MEQDNASQEELLTFLRAHNVAVLATVNTNNTAHATTIFYYPEDDLTFYFLTRGVTKKMNNLKSNNSVALVVSDPVNLQTVQVEGIAREVNYARDFADTMKKFTDNLAKTSEWANLPINHIGSGDSGYFTLVQIQPRWIRWTDYKNWQHVVKYEKTFSES